jgi:hypothetical protein
MSMMIVTLRLDYVPGERELSTMISPVPGCTASILLILIYNTIQVKSILPKEEVYV